MKKLLLIHGPNLNKLGNRSPEIYGNLTLHDIEQQMIILAKEKNFELLCFQSNYEGKLIDILQENAAHCQGILINPGALTHYSYALYDAIIDTQLPTIEVHLSNIKERETWRAHSVISPACIKTIMGKKFLGYQEALDQLVRHINEKH